MVMMSVSVPVAVIVMAVIVMAVVMVIVPPVIVAPVIVALVIVAWGAIRVSVRVSHRLESLHPLAARGSTAI